MERTKPLAVELAKYRARAGARESLELDEEPVEP